MFTQIPRKGKKINITKHIKTLKQNLDNLDYYIFIPFIVLAVIGIIMVYSASSNISIQNGGSPLGYLIRQSMFVCISLFIIMLCLSGNNKFARNSRFLGIFYFTMIIVLLGLKFFGKSVNGSAGWIALGPIHIQPAEVAKAYIILRMSQFISSREDRFISGDRTGLFGQLISICIMLVLILFQPDLGGTVINAAILIVLLFASGINWRGASLLTLLGLVFSWSLLKLLVITHPNGSSNYQMNRIVAYANPFKYARGIGQQLVNSYYALSNGGVFGVGLGNSIQKTGYLPEPNTDFIMSIISEELGLVGILFILILLFAIVTRCVQLGIRSDNTYDTLVCYGVAIYMLVQSFFNVGGAVGLLPITGVTFPFISYGGSSMLTLALCIGMVLVIGSKQKMSKMRNRR
ncbi:FtsW/RodA/SpoVE family cell cycle protein [Apilactobacillus bombintestini]|uniref:Probable peptidoglycan glycosyltransferase FtsW n=1 Tax=Apilactobacillus bombintestini TaxID=2419772 RepID=A0A387AUM9_9LACO|nr:FtsW/RodA/SpoVE family cell cycle protein [Apilactobacillus bombintestini]AYF92456.1 FtsW/RodA/SpoVE family cell cycle protein [Apilactobacillus bombintestini]